MNELDNIEIRSEEVQEILGTPPHWMIRYGTTLALVVMVVLGWLAFWIRYPETIDGNIRISFTEPPRRLIAQQSNYIDEILVRNNQEVKKDESLIVFKSQANFRHVLHLRDLLESISEETDSAVAAFQPNRQLELGELQENFLEFLEKQEQYQRQSDQRYDQRDIDSFQGQIRRLNAAAGYASRRREIIASQIDMAYKEKQVIENQVRQNLANNSELLKIEQDIAQLDREMQLVETDIQEKELEISVLRKQINNVRRGASESGRFAADQMKDSFIKLKIRVDQWVKNHVVQSPIDGIVQIVGANVGEQQFIMEDNELLVVIPIRRRELLGRINLDFDGSGKVRPDQRVVVKLQSYPFPEYGAVEGIVSWKSRVPNQYNQVPVEVLFPRGLLTNTGYAIKPEEELFGEAQIITDEKRLIERLVELGRRAGNLR